MVPERKTENPKEVNMTKDLTLERGILHQIELDIRNNDNEPITSRQVANAISNIMYGTPIDGWARFKRGRHSGSKIKTIKYITDEQEIICYQVIDRMRAKGYLKDAGICKYVLTGKEI